ncbi:LPS O-antigen chain length determinant protein WzzB [Pseudomonas sp. S9]|uniref:LPS O-antigen chain length determinant protein WzzB n=1 Tax=Pseudomonas sp. S9 TaxID=686578 RepID=UPI0002EEFE35|nr:Wzz/FepE/Etk N-terminal domain-containing protein [Pseudomonas sp. S9]
MNQRITAEQSHTSDEIDLVELVKQLWLQKWLIIGCTVLITALAAAYAFLSTPTYQASAGVMPPRLSDIAGYNLGRSEAKLNEFTVEDVYGVYKRNLLSGSLQRQFFDEVYLPSLPAEDAGAAKDKLWDRFNSDFSVQAPDAKNNPDYFVVKVEGKQPEVVAEWANKYVKMAADKSEEGMQTNQLTEIGTKAQSLSRQMDALRATAEKRREDRIARLQEALIVADAVGYDSPQVTPGKTSSDGDFAEFMDGNLMYMRGAKAVKAELAVLEKRTNDDPFIVELRGIENQMDFLQKIDVNPDNVSVFTFDSPALVPETPIAPKKMLILALGIILGVVLGVFLVLVRYVFKSCFSKD